MPAKNLRSDSPRRSDHVLVEREMPRLQAVRSGALSRSRGANVLAVPVGQPSVRGQAPEQGPGTRLALEAAGLDLAEICSGARFTGAAGSLLAFPVTRVHDAVRAESGNGANLEPYPGRMVLVGTGDGSSTALRRAGAALARSCAGADRLSTTVASGLSAAPAQAFAEGLLLGAYTPPRSGTGTGPPAAIRSVDLLGLRHEGAVSGATEAARATWLARDLAATPASTKTPAWVARTAQALAAEIDGLEVEVVQGSSLEDQGFGGIVAVGRGSASPPALVRVTWPGVKGGRAESRHVVLVGKGITFDSGGLSIKPREAMVPMKTDMSGAGVVLATVLAAARRGVPYRISAVLALAENAVGASSYRPGDVVTVWGGTTVEVANTDAEGRMVLADAMAWADATLDPDVLVDVATLTGAASQGLGRRHAALYTADERLASSLQAAADGTGERVWRMPLVEDYRPVLDSEVADLRHVPADGRFGGGGSITAALFLREFAGGRRWVHLDVAGPSRADRDEHEVCKGATGYGARLLLRWLSSQR